MIITFFCLFEPIGLCLDLDNLSLVYKSVY